MSKNQTSSPPMLMNTIVFTSMVIEVLTNCLFRGHRFSGISDWIGCRADSVSPRF